MGVYRHHLRDLAKLFTRYLQRGASVGGTFTPTLIPERVMRDVEQHAVDGLS